MRGSLTAEIPMAEGKRLRIQAGQIRDLAHFEALMAQVDPQMRPEVRALLAQLVPFDVPDAEDPDAT